MKEVKKALKHLMELCEENGISVYAVTSTCDGECMSVGGGDCEHLASAIIEDLFDGDKIDLCVAILRILQELSDDCLSKMN